MSLIKSILDGFHRLFPNTSLLPRERLCLDAWRERLTSEQRHILDAQSSAVHFVQRQAGGAKVVFYYPEGKDTPLFSVRDPDVHTATVTLMTSGGSDRQRMTVKLFVHRGRFFSIEFPKRLERYLEQHSMQEVPLEVEKVEVHRDLG
jgi:hypothetical protein